MYSSDGLIHQTRQSITVIHYSSNTKRCWGRKLRSWPTNIVPFSSSYSFTFQKMCYQSFHFGKHLLQCFPTEFGVILQKCCFPRVLNISFVVQNFWISWFVKCIAFNFLKNAHNYISPAIWRVSNGNIFKLIWKRGASVATNQVKRKYKT